MLRTTAGEGVIEVLICSDGDDTFVGLFDDRGEALVPLAGIAVVSAAGGGLDRNVGGKSIPSDVSVVLGVMVGRWASDSIGGVVPGRNPGASVEIIVGFRVETSVGAGVRIFW